MNSENFIAKEVKVTEKLINREERAKEILNYILSFIFDKFEIVSRSDSKNVYLKVFASKNDYNFIVKNKILMISIKAIVMSYGAKINKKIHVDFVLARQKNEKNK
ncbi:MAG: hypothetical protein ACK4GJ_04250 [bacterium]